MIDEGGATTGRQTPTENLEQTFSEKFSPAEIFHTYGFLQVLQHRSGRLCAL